MVQRFFHSRGVPGFLLLRRKGVVAIVTAEAGTATYGQRVEGRGFIPRRQRFSDQECGQETIPRRGLAQFAEEGCPGHFIRYRTGSDGDRVLLSSYPLASVRERSRESTDER